MSTAAPAREQRTESSESAHLDSFWSQTCGLGEAPKQEEVQSLATEGRRGPPTRFAEGRPNCSRAGSRGKSSKDFQVPAEVAWVQNTGLGVCPELCQEGNDGLTAWGRNSPLASSVCRARAGWALWGITTSWLFLESQATLSLPVFTTCFSIIATVLGTGPRTSLLLGKQPTNELYPISVCCCCFMVKYT